MTRPQKPSWQTWANFAYAARERAEKSDALLREAYKELNTIDAITVSPSDTDGLIELLRRIREHLGDAR